MLEKLLLRTSCKIFRKMSLGVFLLKDWSCPIHPLITIQNLTLPQVFHLFICFENFKIACICGRISVQQKLQGFATLSKNPKSSSSTYFKKSPFNWSCRLTVQNLNPTKKEALTKLNEVERSFLRKLGLKFQLSKHLIYCKIFLIKLNKLA